MGVKRAAFGRPFLYAIRFSYVELRTFLGAKLTSKNQKQGKIRGYLEEYLVISMFYGRREEIIFALLTIQFESLAQNRNM
jgi:hypothetical protein